MKSKLGIFFALFLSSMHCAYASAPTPAPAANSTSAATEYEQNEKKYAAVIEEYKQYLGTIDKQTMKEVQGFRASVDKLNAQKQDLYKRLSQSAQQYLAKEREFKRKLPIKNRGAIKKLNSEAGE